MLPPISCVFASQTVVEDSTALDLMSLPNCTRLTEGLTFYLAQYLLAAGTDYFVALLGHLDTFRSGPRLQYLEDCRKSSR